MSRALDDLDPRFKPLAMALLARLVEAKIPVLIVDTRRTPEEHEANLAAGVSWTTHSKHLDGLAIDVVPFQQFVLHGIQKVQWDGMDPVWGQMGRIGKAIGLRWGGDWTQRDLGHFEYVVPVTTASGSQV